jgi:hypothetical protein
MIILRWWHLNPAPKLAFIQMGLLALDRDCPPRYYGGWAPIARVLGAHPIPESCEVGLHVVRTATRVRGECHRCANAQRAARRAIQQLVAAGAVSVRGTTGPGRPAEYNLWITGPEPGTETAVEETTADAQRPPPADGQRPPFDANGGRSASADRAQRRTLSVRHRSTNPLEDLPLKRTNPGGCGDATCDVTPARTPARVKPTTPMSRRFEVVPDATG